MPLLRKRSYISLIILACAMGITAYLAWPDTHSLSVVSRNPSAAINPQAPASFNKQQYSISAPASSWVVVNKERPLAPTNYTPADLVVPRVPLRVPGNESMQLRQPASQALETMFAGAHSAGIPLMLSSGYRSYSYQVGLYNGYVKSVGQSGADAVSARPGYSEHQTGLAADIEPLDEKCDVSVCFANLPAGKWLAANAYRYGFIVRYPADKTKITGYDYEPWHFRYVGIQLSTEMHKLHVETLEEFFGLPAAPNY